MKKGLFAIYKESVRHPYFCEKCPVERKFIKPACVVAENSHNLYQALCSRHVMSRGDSSFFRLSNIKMLTGVNVIRLKTKHVLKEEDNIFTSVVCQSRTV